MGSAGWTVSIIRVIDVVEALAFLAPAPAMLTLNAVPLNLLVMHDVIGASAPVMSATRRTHIVLSARIVQPLALFTPAPVMLLVNIRFVVMKRVIAAAAFVMTGAALGTDSIGPSSVE